MIHLENHIRKFVPVSAAESIEISRYFRTISCKKKENLLEEGHVCKYNYFVSTGCLRMFYTNEKGVEKTVQFALENWWLADYFSFQRQEISSFSIQAVEPSQLLAIDLASQEKMLQEFPQLERYFRMVHQTAHAAAQIKAKHFSGLSKEELYRSFSTGFPEFVQRIPQYLLASYLGFTPEYLSEICAKYIS